jgi:lysophospholipase L1-like esterase
MSEAALDPGASGEGGQGGEPAASAARPRLGSRLLALLVSLSLTLAVVEIILRVAFPAQTRYYVWPPRTLKVLRPDPTHMPGVSGDTHFTVNTQGIRGKELGPDTDYRILAIGGSTTECLYLDDDEAWPAIVGAALPKTDDGREVWMGNVGKAGTYSRDHVVQLAHLAPQLPRLDTVLVLVGINDLTVTLAQGDHYAVPAPITDPEADRQQVRRAFAIAPGRLQDVSTDELGPSDAAFYKRTALYQLVKRTRAGLASQAGGRGLAQDEFGKMYADWRDHRAHPAEMRMAPPDLATPLAEYRRNLGVMADLATARGVRLVLMTQPTMWRADLPKAAMDLLWLGGVGSFQEQPGKAYYSVPVLAETMRRYNDVLLDVCRERGLPCLDLATKIPRDPSMFYDDCHFTEAGSRAVATVVGRHLRHLAPFTAGPQ